MARSGAAKIVGDRVGEGFQFFIGRFNFGRFSDEIRIQPSNILLLLLHLRDVPIGPDHSFRPPGALSVNLAVRADVMHRVVGPENAKFGIKIFLAADGFLNLPISAVPILGMDAVQPGAIGSLELLLGDSVEGIHGLIPIQSVLDRFQSQIPTFPAWVARSNRSEMR